MYISDQDHEFWYGDNNTAKKMYGRDVETFLHCNLKYFNIENSEINFTSSINKIKKSLRISWPPLIKLFSTEISHLNLMNSNLNTKKNMELITA